MLLTFAKEDLNFLKTITWTDEKSELEGGLTVRIIFFELRKIPTPLMKHFLQNFSLTVLRSTVSNFEDQLVLNLLQSCWYQLIEKILKIVFINLVDNIIRCLKICGYDFQDYGHWDLQGFLVKIFRNRLRFKR